MCRFSKLNSQKYTTCYKVWGWKWIINCKKYYFPHWTTEYVVFLEAISALVQSSANIQTENSNKEAGRQSIDKFRPKKKVSGRFKLLKSTNLSRPAVFRSGVCCYRMRRRRIHLESFCSNYKESTFLRLCVWVCEISASFWVVVYRHNIVGVISEAEG